MEDNANKNVLISESDMDTLADKFKECSEKATNIANSLTNMKSCLVDEVYFGLGLTLLKSNSDNLNETASELANLYDGLSSYISFLLKTFKEVDSESGKDAKDNVVEPK